MTVILVVVTLALPYIPFVHVFGFVPLPASLVAMLLVITALYVVAAELMKSWFYRGTV